MTRQLLLLLFVAALLQGAVSSSECQAYSNWESTYHCGDSSYFTGYGLKYCNRFDRSCPYPRGFRDTVLVRCGWQAVGQLHEDLPDQLSSQLPGMF